MLKRLVLIAMLALVPLQASWAVVSTYCWPEEVGCIDPCYSSSAEQEVYSTKVTKQVPQSSDMMVHYDHSCHGFTAFLISSSPETLPLHTNSAPRLLSATLNLGVLAERPERPQWISHI